MGFFLSSKFLEKIFCHIHVFKKTNCMKSSSVLPKIKMLNLQYYLRMKTNFKIRNKKCCIGQIYEREKAHCIVYLKTSFHKKKDI